MIAVDTNILVYAHGGGCPEHARALQWLGYLAEGLQPWGLPLFCLGEFLRLVTHPRVLTPPSSMDKAWGALHGLLKSPSLRLLAPGPDHVAWLEQLMRQGDARGNLVFDAQIAAVCLEHGADRLLTADRDFARFPGLRLLSLASEPSAASQASARGRR